MILASCLWVLLLCLLSTMLPSSPPRLGFGSSRVFLRKPSFFSSFICPFRGSSISKSQFIPSHSHPVRTHLCFPCFTFTSQLLLLVGSRSSCAKRFSGCATANFAEGGFLNRLVARANNEAPFETKLGNVALHKGLLVEFQKDSGRIVVGVTQHREGKKNWNVIDQNAATYIVRPKQIKVVVPGAENFNPEDVSHLLREVELLQDPTLLEIAWEETISKNKTVDIKELALILYGSTTPEKCYSAYRLLSSNPSFFRCKDDGYSPTYEPRPLAQVKH